MTSGEQLIGLMVAHPDAEVIAHPECEDAILRHAHFVASTSADQRVRPTGRFVRPAGQRVRPAGHPLDTTPS